MLKDYPEHLARLQQVLNIVLEKPPSITPKFERALWALEGRLETFISEAREELNAAEATGDPETIARAKRKELLMLHSSSSGNWDCENLMDYFGFPEGGQRP